MSVLALGGRPGTSGQLEVNPAVYADIDAALAIAEARDVYLVFNLFAGVGPDNMPVAWVNDPAMRVQLANALAPMFSRYASNSRLMAWDIFNEPEWQIWNGLAKEANAVALARVIADEIHASGPTLVTIGEAQVSGIPMWDDAVSLDFHSPHSYSNFTGEACALPAGPMRRLRRNTEPANPWSLVSGTPPTGQPHSLVGSTDWTRRLRARGHGRSSPSVLVITHRSATPLPHSSSRPT